MHFISASIVRFVDDSQPGWVECEFYDANGHGHILTGKVPIFTDKMLDAHSIYPAPGEIPCEVLKRFQDAKGRFLASVTTDKPCSLESAEGLSEFTVPASLLTSTPD